MDKLLAKFERGCLKFPNRFLFNEPATRVDIETLEKKLKLQLPKSYKTFLLSFNGGFINDTEAGEQMSVADAAWNSNFIHGLRDIEAAFTRKSGKWKKSQNGTLFIPFCSTDCQETLVFRNPLNENGESPVIDAWHEAPPGDWETLYETFADLLRDYVENEGKINTIA